MEDTTVGWIVLLLIGAYVLYILAGVAELFIDWLRNLIRPKRQPSRPAPPRRFVPPSGGAGHLRVG